MANMNDTFIPPEKESTIISIINNWEILKWLKKQRKKITKKLIPRKINR